MGRIVVLTVQAGLFLCLCMPTAWAQDAQPLVGYLENPGASYYAERDRGDLGLGV